MGGNPGSRHSRCNRHRWIRDLGTFLQISAVCIHRSPTLVPGGQTKGAYLRVQNRSERPIIVSWPNGSSPNSLRIALNHDTRSIVVSLIDGRTSVAIDGHSTQIFPILRPNNWADLNDEQTVEVSVKWRFAQPLLFKRHRSIAVRITKQAYKLLVDEREDLD